MTASPLSPAAAAEALFRRAEAEDEAGDYAPAVVDYRAAIAALPSSRHAPRAATRASLLEAHSEGAWAPFARLESVRRDPKASDDARAIDALARDAITFPPGPTRGEAWMVCASAYVSRLHRRKDGEDALRRVVGDPRADPLLRREAASELVNALLDDGDFDAAGGAVAELGTTLDARVARRVVVLERRRRVHLAAIGDLALFVALVAISMARAAQARALGVVAGAVARTARTAAPFAVYVAMAGGVLASAYESGNAAPFFAFAGALLGVLLAARAWGAAGRSTRPCTRSARAVISASAVLAAAFLVLEAISGQYLEGFSL